MRKKINALLNKYPVSNERVERHLAVMNQWVEYIFL